jgi:hypothetical protein
LTGDVLAGKNIRLVDANRQAAIVQSSRRSGSLKSGQASLRPGTICCAW